MPAHIREWSLSPVNLNGVDISFIKKNLRSLMAALQEPPMTLIAATNGFWKQN